MAILSSFVTGIAKNRRRRRLVPDNLSGIQIIKSVFAHIGAIAKRSKRQIVSDQCAHLAGL
jgi:hypothetical protein